MAEPSEIRSNVAAGPRDRATAVRPERRYLRVCITALANGDTIVDLTIPTNLVPVGIRLGAGLAPLLDAAASDRLHAMLDTRTTGPILEADNPEQGEHVSVWVE
jgi:hypothetical protein